MSFQFLSTEEVLYIHQAETELADKILDFIEKKFTEKEFADYLRINAQKTI